MAEVKKIELKKIDLHNLESMGQEFVEKCNLLREKQDEIETTLNEISRNESDFKAGKVAKQAFEFNHQKFSQEAEREKKDLSQHVTSGIRVLDNLGKFIKSQDIKLPEEIMPPKKVHHHAVHHLHHKVHHAKHHAKHHTAHHAKHHAKHHTAHHAKHGKRR